MTQYYLNCICILHNNILKKQNKYSNIKLWVMVSYWQVSQNKQKAIVSVTFNVYWIFINCLSQWFFRSLSALILFSHNVCYLSYIRTDSERKTWSYNSLIFHFSPHEIASFIFPVLLSSTHSIRSMCQYNHYHKNRCVWTSTARGGNM